MFDSDVIGTGILYQPIYTVSAPCLLYLSSKIGCRGRVWTRAPFEGVNTFNKKKCETIKFDTSAFIWTVTKGPIFLFHSFVRNDGNFSQHVQSLVLWALFVLLLPSGSNGIHRRNQLWTLITPHRQINKYLIRT